jgi:hypothetical protein
MFRLPATKIVESGGKKLMMLAFSNTIGGWRNFFNGEDLKLFEAIVRREFNMRGFHSISFKFG